MCFSGFSFYQSVVFSAWDVGAGKLGTDLID